MIWRAVLGLLLLLACTVLGYHGAKGNGRAKFVTDVLDKANKTYKPTLEFAILAAKFFTFFVKR